MQIIPAIDILDGQCVRLVQGDYTTAHIYDQDPVATARMFEQAGASRIHIVDLDAAHGDRSANRKKIRKIRKAVSCTLEVGGGIRSEDDIEELLDLGIDRLVLGTVFATKPDIVEGWNAHYGDVFLVGIDARDGMVYVSGWERETSVPAEELARKAAKVGASGIIYTNIARDGTLEGPDIEGTNRIAEVSGLPVILSGGIGNEEHLKLIAGNAHAKVVGVITGKAIYEKQLDLQEMIAQYQDIESGETSW